MVYTLYGTPYTNFIFQMNFVLITGYNPDVQPKFLRNFTERNGTEMCTSGPPRKTERKYTEDEISGGNRKSKFPGKLYPSTKSLFAKNT